MQTLDPLRRAALLPLLALPALALPALQEGAPEPAAKPDEPRGLRLRTDEALDGYTLFAPLRSTTTYLIDMDGEVVHTWPSEHAPGNSVYLMDDARLLRACRMDSERFGGGGQGGRIQEHAWDGALTWDLEFNDDTRMQHHDIEPLPSGNVLVLAWEARTRDEALAAGRDPAQIGDRGFWPDWIAEVVPVRPDGARIVWEWHAFDHLIQDLDPAQGNYGDVTAHPERIDVNGDQRGAPPLSEAERKRQEELEREMRALGYAGGDDQPDATPRERDRARLAGDWLHTNSLAYLREHDLIALSVRHFNEVWVIDHSTSSAEARGTSGGRFGRGGDVLWRWGNPRTYGHGNKADQQLFGQHDASWIRALDGGLHVLVFNNGEGRPDASFSSVDELVLPFDPQRGFTRASGAAFGPEGPLWRYSDGPRFFSSFISGAQRLENGNTLVCSGADGRVLEVSVAGLVVWEYLNPFGGEVPLFGRGGGPPAPRAGEAGARRERDEPRGGNLIPKGLFRATRIARDHPALVGRDL